MGTQADRRAAHGKYEAWLVILPPGGERAYDESEWRDAIVLVERGEIDLECVGGHCRRFGRGDILWLSPLPLRALRNRGRELVVLLAVSRRAGARAWRASDELVPVVVSLFQASTAVSTKEVSGT